MNKITVHIKKGFFITALPVKKMKDVRAVQGILVEHREKSIIVKDPFYGLVECKTEIIAVINDVRMDEDFCLSIWKQHKNDRDWISCSSIEEYRNLVLAVF